MIVGAVNENLEVTIRLNLHGISGETQDIEAMVDTGFMGHLTLSIQLSEHLAKSRPCLVGGWQPPCLRRIHRYAHLGRAGPDRGGRRGRN